VTTISVLRTSTKETEPTAPSTGSVLLPVLSQCHTRRNTVAENGGCRRKRRENGDSRRIRRQSHFSATVWTGLYVDVELRRTVVGPGMSFKLRVSTILSLTTIPNLRKQIKEGHRLTCVYRKNGHKIKYMYFVCSHSQKDRKIGDADGVRVLNVRHN